MRIALIGDIHLYSLQVHPKRLLSKRVFAHTNLLMNRRHRFNHGLMPALVDHVLYQNAELALFSGDVTTSSLEREFTDLVKYIKPLTDEMPAVLVPGNHDRYTFKSRRTRRIEQLLDRILPQEFPHSRELNPSWRLMALDSAIPNKFFSRGALGREQFDKAVFELEQLPEDSGLIVLCHYPCTLPPRTPHAWSHDLREAIGLRDALSRCKARVVYMHGHIHKPWHFIPNGEAKSPIELINAGSPCYTTNRYPMGQGYWTIDLPDDPHAPLKAEHWVPDADGHSVAAPQDVRWIADPSI